MVLEVILFICGILLLLKSADWIIDGASTLAVRLNIPPMIIGLTIVAFGTSLPELIVSIMSGISGSSEIVFGNVIGSNIANILLVLGLTAVFGRVKLKVPTIWQEIPFVLLATFVLYILTSPLFTSKEFLTASDGLMFLSLFLFFMYYLLQRLKGEKREHKEAIKSQKKDTSKLFESPFEINRNHYLVRLLGGVVGIYIAAVWVVDGVRIIAQSVGISEYLISATVIALGTSLPEVAVSFRAIKKSKTDLAIGNILGSNIFNILWIIGITALISPLAIPSFLSIDIAIAFFAALLMFIFMFIGKKHELRREDGILLLLLYVLYIGYLLIRG